jgi:hypothetical protein
MSPTTPPIMSPEEYTRAVSERLSSDGAQVGTVPFRGGPALVGYRPQFRLRWMAVRLNLFTVVVSQPVVSAAALEEFSVEALTYALGRKGDFRGLQNGVAVIPVMLGSQVEPDAVAMARDKLIRRFSAFAWPTVVDLTTGTVHKHEGRVLVGGIFAAWMRQQTKVALPGA